MYSNYEIGVLVKGENAWKLAELMDVLASRGKAVATLSKLGSR